MEFKFNPVKVKPVHKRRNNKMRVESIRLLWSLLMIGKRKQKSYMKESFDGRRNNLLMWLWKKCKTQNRKIKYKYYFKKRKFWTYTQKSKKWVISKEQAREIYGRLYKTWKWERVKKMANRKTKNSNSS